jgi:hypothetical protein
MSYKHGTMRPFGAPQSGPNIDLDESKPGRTKAMWRWWWIRVLHSDYTEADTSQALNLADLADTLVASSTGARRCSGAIPTDCDFGLWRADLREVFAGGTIAAATMILGYSGDDNGYLTSTDVFTGATLGRKKTAGATLWAMQPLAGDPLLQLDTTTGTVAAATTGCIDIYALFMLDPESQYYDGSDS